MSVLDRYVFRQVATSFIGGLVVLTIVVWVTQVLRQIDLVTNNGQTVLVFLSAASLVIPMLLNLLSPIALFVAVVQTLNKLSGDSELIVMSAAGMAPRRLMRPYMIAAVAVSVFVAALALHLSPVANRSLRELFSKINANILTVIIQPGQFSRTDRGLTFHIRDRTPGGVLRGIIVSDSRDPQLQTTYVAERGVIAELPQGNFFVLEDGSMQRRQVDGEMSMVQFDRYALDLSEFTKEGETNYKPSERYLWELFAPKSKDDFWTKHQPGAYVQEICDRFAAPLYPIAMMCIAFALLGRARTTRQSRTWSILGAVGAMALVRGLGFAVSALVAGAPILAPLIFAVPLGAIMIYGVSALGYVDLLPSERILSAVTDPLLKLVRRVRGSRE